MMRIVKILFVLSFSFSTLLAFNSIRFQYGLRESFWRTLMTPFEGTVWAPGFKESAFGRLHIGMLADEVLKTVGEPIRKNCTNGSCFWIYTWQDTPTADFDQRWVIFDSNDRITEIRKSFFID